MKGKMTQAKPAIDVRHLATLDDVKSFILDGSAHRLTQPIVVGRIEDIYNGFFKILASKDGQLVGIDFQKSSHREPPHINRIDFHKYHQALWDWYDNKPGPGNLGDLNRWLDDMPSVPRP